MNNNDGFSIITPTSRIDCKENIIRNFINQKYSNKELIIIINQDSIKEDLYYDYIKIYNNISIYKLPESSTLGECINFGIEKSKYNYIAKFDDDDYYSPYYIHEAYNAFIENNCDVVGKVNMYFFLEGLNILTSYNYNGKTSSYVDWFDGTINWIGGATICCKKSVFDILKFKEVNVGEDNDFIKRCAQNKLKVYSTSKYNYVAYRYIDHTKHTWKITQEEFVKSTKIIKDDVTFKEACNLVIKSI